MKRLALILALAVAALFGVSGSASAANCSFGQNISYKTGTTIYFAVSAYNCSDVEAVRIKWAPVEWVGHTGWYDYAAGAEAQGKIGVNIGTGAYADYTMTGSCVSACVAYVWQTIWWSGACRTVGGQWFVQIKRAATHTWGSVGSLGNPTNSICN